jgi:hypothetical protein
LPAACTTPLTSKWPRVGAELLSLKKYSRLSPSARHVRRRVGHANLEVGDDPMLGVRHGSLPAHGLIFNSGHRLAAHPTIEVEDLRQELWLRRAYCEQAEQTAALIRSHHLDVDKGHELTSERDLITLLEAGLGVAFVPRTAPRPATLKHSAPRHPRPRLDLARISARLRAPRSTPRPTFVGENPDR